MIKQLKRFKMMHWAYNLWHYKSLLHNKEAFQRYHIHQPLFASLSSKNFPDRQSKAWLDIGSSKDLAPSNELFFSFPKELQAQILDWSDNGFLILKDFFSSQTIDDINKEIEKLSSQNKLKPTHDNKLMFANKISHLIRETTQEKRLLAILDFILGKQAVPFQTINFIYGSGQRAHSDSIHMTTYPLGYLIAAWIALEDTNEENGPLFYYPGSHRLPYLLNDDFNNTGSAFSLGKKDYPDYEDAIEELIQKYQLKKKIFLAKKGDVLIWHANLIHGGTPVVNKALTRKSMVIHYFAKEVIKYHEISERPSLLSQA